MPHCNTIVNGDRIELSSKTAHLLDFGLHNLSDLVQMCMTRHKLRE